MTPPRAADIVMHEKAVVSRGSRVALGAVLFTAVTIAMVVWADAGPRTSGWVDPVTGVRFVVEARGEHALLVDHDRVLFVVSPTGGVRRIDLYPCAGTPVSASLYRLADGRLLLIDANGVWITVTERGDVERQRLCWGAQPEGTFVGSYQAGADRRYALETSRVPDVYQFKDPPGDIAPR